MDTQVTRRMASAFTTSAGKAGDGQSLTMAAVVLLRRA